MEQMRKIAIIAIIIIAAFVGYKAFQRYQSHHAHNVRIQGSGTGVIDPVTGQISFLPSRNNITPLAAVAVVAIK